MFEDSVMRDDQQQERFNPYRRDAMLADAGPRPEDHQLPGVGFRSDPSPPMTRPRQSNEAMRPALLLLTGLGAIIPVTALVIPTRRQRLQRAADTTATAPLTAGIAAIRPTPRRRYRRGLLLATILGGGAAAFVFAWRDRQERATAERKPALAAPRSGSPTPKTFIAETSPPVAYSAASPGAPAREPQASQRPATVATSRPKARQTTGEGTHAQAEATQTAQPTTSATAASAPAAGDQASLQAPLTPTTDLRTEGAPEPATTRMNQAELASHISTHMTVVDNKGMRIGAVDRVDGTERIRLTKDGQGRQHIIPLGWVARVDTQVHLDRAAKEARQAWKARQPRGR